MTKRLLLIDNDPDFIDSWSEALERAGYQVLAADSAAAAERLLAGRWVQAMTVDVRLIDDDDERDKSGLTLVRDVRYWSVPKIVLTGFPTLASDVMPPQAQGLPPNVYWVEKMGGLDRLLETLDTLFARHYPEAGTAVRWLEPDAPQELLGWLSPGTDQIHPQELGEELEETIRRLFAGQRQVTISRLLAREPGRVVLAAVGHDEHESRPVALILGRRENMEAELSRYERYAPKNSHGVHVLRKATATALHYAAATFEIVGAPVERLLSFERCYRAYPGQMLQETVARLFGTSLTPWHGLGRSLQLPPLEEFRRSLAGLAAAAPLPAVQLGQLQGLAQELMHETSVQCDVTLESLGFRPTPAADTTVLRNPIPYLVAGAITVSRPLLWGITYGLLSDSAVMSDGRGGGWTLDFRHNGPGPVMRDFVDLEMAIKTRLLDSPDTGQRLALEQVLAAAGRLDEPVVLPDAGEPVQKAALTITAVRQSAASALGPEPDSYLVGLFYASIAQLAAYQPDVRHTPAELLGYLQSLLSAALLCPRLSALPPQAVTGLWIDPESGAVWVEGRQKSPGPQENAVLVFMNERPERLCDREELLGALGSNYPGAALAEPDRLDKIMSRLRESIEPQREKPRYIETVRGEGYVLHLRPGPGHNQR
jgi:DNA-binding response OmpR family regulator